MSEKFEIELPPNCVGFRLVDYGAHRIQQYYCLIETGMFGAVSAHGNSFKEAYDRCAVELKELRNGKR